MVFVAGYAAAAGKADLAVHPVSSHKQHVEIIAHRGASHDAPENTLAAVELAWKQKTDAVEVDAYLTKDGRIIMAHDGDTKRVAGVDRRIAEQTLAELQTLDIGRWKGKEWTGSRMPTLAQVLAVLPAGKRMLIEVKCGPEILPELKRVLAESRHVPEQIAFISFSLGVCTAMKQALPRHQVYLLCGFRQDEKTGKWFPAPQELIAAARKANLDGLDLASDRPVNRSLVHTLHEAGLKVYVWTVDDPAEARRLAEAGVDGITTNRPEFLRRQITGPAR